MEILYSAKTDVGKKRDHNEDAVLVDEDVHLYGVCDGMGGHAAGEVASAIAVETIKSIVEENRDLIAKSEEAGDALERFEILHMLEHSIQTACNKIHDAAQADSEKRGMGTTCSLLMVIGDRGFIGHVGDSRVYLVRKGLVHQLTEDHSLVNELVRRGKMKRDEVEGSPYAEYKNAVTRAVGVYPSVDPDTLDFNILPGDQFLLCSDGLHFYLNDKNISEVFAEKDLDEANQKFIDLANDGGGHDNISSVIVRVSEAMHDEQEERAEEIHLTLELLRQIPLFKFCTYKELVLILNSVELKDYVEGDKVIEEGNEGDYLFVVMRGRVKLHKGEAFITEFTEGNHFGEMALVDKTPRSASVTALEPSRLLRLHRRDFYSFVRSETALSVKLLWSFVQVLADRLRDTTRDLSQALQDNALEDLTEEAEDLTEEAEDLTEEAEDLTEEAEDEEAEDEEVEDEEVEDVAADEDAAEEAEDEEAEDSGAEEQSTAESPSAEDEDMARDTEDLTEAAKAIKEDPASGK